MTSTASYSRLVSVVPFSQYALTGGCQRRIMDNEAADVLLS